MGLTLNTGNGKITLSSSTAGNYEVTRTVTNSPGSLSTTATDIVTINPADNAAFSYSGSPFDIADASNPTPTVTGLPSGTFSSISGFNFDGTDDITLPSITLSNDFAFSFWFYTASSSALMFFFGEGSNWCRINNGVFDVKFSGYQLSDTDPSNQPTFTIPTNQWNNVILVKDSNSLIQVYFNGQVDPNYTLKGVSTPSTPPPVNASFSPGLIGRRSPQYFTGKLSSFALWNSDQSSNISNIYNNGVPQGSYTSTPYVWYKMSNDATYNSSTSTWSIPNAANPGTLDASSTTLPSNSLDYLDINSSTGLISLSSSNVGTYSVSYNTTGATGSICPATDTQSVQLVNTNFDYPSSVCNAAESPDVVPTNFIQQTGGQFTISPSSGMTINATDGTISTAGSTAATYAITYTIGSNSTTRNVTSTNILIPTTVSNLQTLTLNATNNYIDAGNDSSIQIFTGSHSYSFWVKKPVVSEAYIVGYGIDSVVIFNGDGRIRFYTGGLATADLYSTNSLSANTWHHVVCTYDTNGDKKIYIDGVEENDISTSGSISTNGLRLTIGAKYVGSYSHFFIGNIDEIAIWNKVLTSCDAAGIFEASAHQVTADLSTVYPNNLKYYNRMGD